MEVNFGTGITSFLRSLLGLLNSFQNREANTQPVTQRRCAIAVYAKGESRVFPKKSSRRRHTKSNHKMSALMNYSRLFRLAPSW